MNNLLTSPTGIDIEIQEIQTWLYDSLILRWTDSIDAYGRIYKNKDENDDTFYPQRYSGDDEYKKDVYLNDAFAVTSMFIVDDESKSEDGFLFVSEVKCVFMVNLKKILPLSTDRADSEAQRDVIEYLREISMGVFDINGIETGIGNVFSGFNQEKIKDIDIHPYHCFSIGITLSYSIDDKCG